MRNFLKLLFHRISLVTLCILLQLAALIIGVKWLWELSPWISAGLTLLSWALVLVILSGKTNTAYKVAWIIPILALPVFGLVLYLFFGGNRLSARLKRKLQSMDQYLHDNLKQNEAVCTQLEQQCPEAAFSSHYLRQLDYPVYTSTGTRYFPSGETCWAVMLEELEKAQHTIYLEYFIICPGRMWDTIVDILEKKVKQGVDVRLIYDDFGCIRKLPAGYAKTLERRGIRVAVFNPYIPVLSSRLNNRDHRKLMIIDGNVAFTGGINHADEYINEHDRHCGHWKDCGVMLKGPAVWSMSVMFFSMWNHITGQSQEQPPLVTAPVSASHGFVQPFLDSPLELETVCRNTFLNLITRARRYVYIMTPYLILDETICEALMLSAKSGVDVRLVTPSIGDKGYVHVTTRANYERLLEAGCHILEYQPGFVHSKLMLVDDCMAVVGTVNLDFRSMYLHFENGVFLCNADCIREIQQDFEETFAVSREISLQECRHQPWYLRVFCAFLRIFAPLM